MVKLTKKDKQNINLLAALADLLAAGKKANSGHSLVNFNRNQDQLIQYGFSFGITHGSMFGTDNTGQVWQVTTVDEGPAHNRGRFTRTVWYQINERGVGIKQDGGMSWERFYNLFGQPRTTK